VKEQETFARDYLDKIRTLCGEISTEEIAGCLEILEDAYRNQRSIFVVGNGGSASTASHCVCDLGKTILGKDLCGTKTRFKVFCLSDNVPLLTALGNDCSYDRIFSEPLKNYATEGDVLLAITGSGNSPNIVEAVKTAKELKMRTLAFLGFGGGKVKDMVDAHILVPSSEYGPVEDFHLIFNHLITSYFLSRNN
jgi:D-sedoheptulose 7-phosphate isomerase